MNGDNGEAIFVIGGAVAFVVCFFFWFTLVVLIASCFEAYFTYKRWDNALSRLEENSIQIKQALCLTHCMQVPMSENK
jgi:Sec-independent protein secretion pathway component TatC